MARDTSKMIPLRKHTPWRVHDAINRKTCLHVDAWLYQSRDDVLYFVIETRAGGWQVLARTTFRAEPSGLYAVAGIADIEREYIQRHVDSPWARRFPWLRVLHRTHIAPLLYAPMEGFKSRSIILHYVHTLRAVDDPFAGLENLYSITDRAARDAARMSPERRAGAADALRYGLEARGIATPAWNAKERSILRTLGKLLQ